MIPDTPGDVEKCFLSEFTLLTVAVSEKITLNPMFSRISVVIDRAAMPSIEIMPSNRSTRATLTVDVICAENVDMPFLPFFSIYGVNEAIVT